MSDPAFFACTRLGITSMLESTCARRWRIANGQDRTVKQALVNSMRQSKCLGCPDGEKRASEGVHKHRERFRLAQAPVSVSQERSPTRPAPAPRAKRGDYAVVAHDEAPLAPMKLEPGLRVRGVPSPPVPTPELVPVPFAEPEQLADEQAAAPEAEPIEEPTAAEGRSDQEEPMPRGRSAKQYETRTCDYKPCSVEFTPNGPRQRFHAPECKAAAKGGGTGKPARAARAPRAAAPAPADGVAYSVRIGNVTVECNSIEALDALVERYR